MVDANIGCCCIIGNRCIRLYVRMRWLGSALVIFMPAVGGHTVVVLRLWFSLIASNTGRNLSGWELNRVSVCAAAVQAWLEVAWQAGFDPVGATMFGNKVQCSRKWLGASDAAALMRYFGCKALLTEFIGEAVLAVRLVAHKDTY